MCQLLTDVFHYIKYCKAFKFAQKNAQLFSFNDISNRKYFISNKIKFLNRSYLGSF